eukprot:s2001_g11.t1
MQRSAADEASVDQACAICNRLPQEALSPAAVLLAATAEDNAVQENFDWNRDLLDMDPSNQAPWRSSVIAHVLCFLGAAHRSVCNGPIPLALEPFRAFLTLDQQALGTNFWPGLPDSFWQALRYAGLHKHGLPPNANIAWAQCDCGYRYCYGACAAPASFGPCPSPNISEGQGACTRSNGGQGHKFCPGQRLVAIVATQPPHGIGWPPIYADMSRDFPAAADESISVKRTTRTSVAQSLMTETVRQDWNQPFGKPPPPGSGLRPVTFRVLHLLVHASALIGVGMEWAQDQERLVHLLQEHLHHVAMMNPVRDQDDTVWYFMANVEADLAALAKQLNSTVEVAALFVHAILHKLGEAELAQPDAVDCTSPAGRNAYEAWFDANVVLPVLGVENSSGGFSLPGVQALRRLAGQARDPTLVLSTDLLARRAPPSEAWDQMNAHVRACLLPHVLRPPICPDAETTYEELVKNGEAASLVILRLVMAGRAEEGSWPVRKELARAASLAWILPFMRLVREKEGGRITMREARKIKMRDWLEKQAKGQEQQRAWALYRDCEAAWNAALSAGNIQDGCGRLTLPKWSLSSPLALACPICEPEPLQFGDLTVGDYPDPAEHCAAVGLHELALNHNKVLAQVKTYLQGPGSSHIQARLHNAEKFLCTAEGSEGTEGTCCAESGEASILLLQHATVPDLLVLPAQLQDACASQEEEPTPADEPFPEKKLHLDFQVNSLLERFYQYPWSADGRARGGYDFQAMEQDLALRLVAGRRPLQVRSQDHKELQADIEDFPYRIYHGNVDVRILNRVKADCRRLAPQVSLNNALGVHRAEELEAAFFRNSAKASEVSRITGDLIALLLGARHMDGIIRGDMTLRQFAEVFTIAESSFPNKTSQSHPDALMRIANMQEIAEVPLRALTALHLLSRDLLAMTQGVSVQFRDAKDECTDAADLPAELDVWLDELRNAHPEVLLCICRLMSRVLYLSCEKPLATRQPHNCDYRQPPMLAQMVVGMDVVEELSAVCSGVAERYADEPVPSSLWHWNDWEPGHTIAAFKKCCESWRQVREPYLAPTRTVLACFADPGISSGMVKPSVWRRANVGVAAAKRPAKLKKMKKAEELADSSDDGQEMACDSWSGQPTGMESELHVLTASQQRILQQLGLRRQPTPSDGACQFHAVSTAVDEDAMAVRGNAIAYIRQHPADFEDFVEGSLEEYLIRMSDPCQWGDHVTLIAIAEHYKRPVRVISDREDADFQVDPVRSYPASSDTPICVLFYAELHYEATVQDTSSAATLRCPEVV